MALRLLVSALILVWATSAQAQRQTAATHIVRPGETLGLIAQHYGVDIYALASANGISNAHLIHTWQELTIPTETTPIEARGTHIVRRGESLDSIAKLYDIDVRDLMVLNNIFGWIYPGNELALPVPGQTAAPDQSVPPPPTTSSHHIVRRGETLGTIAEAYGVSLYDLQAANNLWTWIIYVGQELEIPGGGSAVLDPETPEPAPHDDQDAPPIPDEPVINSSGITHTVQFGETLGTIAKAYGVSLYELQTLNNIQTWIIYVGQELEIPEGGAPPEPTNAPDTTSATDVVEEPSAPAPATPAPDKALTHTVKRGETLFRIAKKYGVALDALVRANGIADATKIHAGLVLRVSNLERFAPPAPARTAANPAPASRPVYTGSRTQYTVKPGDFLSRIGAKFGMNWLAIRDINAISDPNNLNAGAILQIPTKAEAERYGPVVITNYSRFHSSNDHPGPKIGVGKEIVVVLSTQTAYAYQNGQLLRRALMSSGLPDTPTVQGDFKVRTKVRSQRMTGDDYDLDNVEWVMYFYQAYALHGTWWHNNFGSPMSHGCVNMTNADAKWFYDFAPIGTPVHVRLY